MAVPALPVIIVGGGIGGMATALAFAKQNIPSIILERAAQFREAGAGIQFCPNSFKILDFLGISKAFEDIAIFPDHICYVDGLLDFEFVRLPLGSKMVERFNHPFGSFHREDVLKTFGNECKKSPLIRMIPAAKVIDIQEKTDRVLAITEDQTIYEGEIVVGCDGIWSVVRKFVEENVALRVSGQIIYRGVVPESEMPGGLQLGNITHYVRPGAHLVYYPIGTKGDFNISAIFQTDRLPDTKESIGNKEEFYSYFEGSIPKVMELVERVDTSRMWPLCDIEPLSNWSKGRIVLLGDAAHATLPYLTSGAGMAVEDAVVLAQKVVENPTNYSLAFKQYQEERRLRTAYVQLFSRMYGDVHHSKGIARELRNHLVSKRSIEENYEWVSYLYKGIDLPQDR